MNLSDRYKNLNSIKAIISEKKILKKNIIIQEQILVENWEEIKKPFQFTNMAISAAGLLLPAKKGRWLPLIFSGYKIISSFLKKSKKKK